MKEKLLSLCLSLMMVSSMVAVGNVEPASAHNPNKCYRNGVKRSYKQARRDNLSAAKCVRKTSNRNVKMARKNRLQTAKAYKRAANRGWR